MSSSTVIMEDFFLLRDCDFTWLWKGGGGIWWSSILGGVLKLTWRGETLSLIRLVRRWSRCSLPSILAMEGLSSSDFLLFFLRDALCFPSFSASNLVLVLLVISPPLPLLENESDVDVVLRLLNDFAARFGVGSPCRSSQLSRRRTGAADWRPSLAGGALWLLIVRRGVLPFLTATPGVWCLPPRARAPHFEQIFRRTIHRELFSPSSHSCTLGWRLQVPVCGFMVERKRLERDEGRGGGKEGGGMVVCFAWWFNQLSHRDLPNPTTWIGVGASPL